MATPIACTVVTPTEELLSEPVVYASVPLEDGLMGIVHGREPMLAPLGLGELRLDFPDSSKAGGSRVFMVDGGFVQMSETKLTILAEKAIAAENIVERDAQAELAEAEARTVPAGTKNPSDEQAKINHERARARLKVRLAQSVRRTGI